MRLPAPAFIELSQEPAIPSWDWFPAAPGAAADTDGKTGNQKTDFIIKEGTSNTIPGLVTSSPGATADADEKDENQKTDFIIKEGTWIPSWAWFQADSPLN